VKQQLLSVLGLAVFLGLCWAASTRRKSVRWRVVAWGMGLQVLFALLILKTAPGYAVFDWLSGAFARLIGFTDAGAEFVWGHLYREKTSFVFFLHALMPIVFFSALMTLLYHLGVMQWVVCGIAKLMQRTMGTSGSETLTAAANIFVGQTEAPLVVKPYVETMTLSELHAVMTTGFATIAGGVLAAYVSFGIDAGHLVAASFMSAPAALVCAKMLYPETAESVTAGEVKVKLERTTSNVFDALCSGAADGMRLVLNVAAMVLAFLAVIAMVNYGLGSIHPSLTLERIFGWLLYPVAFLMGVPREDCARVGELLGQRMVANEFVAYLRMRELEMSARAHVIATYAFCGFANFGSIAIQIGGISTVAPSRRADLARLGLRAMLAGTIASFLTASIAGALLTDEQMERDYRKNRGRAAATAEKEVREYDAFLEKYPGSGYAAEFRALRENPLKRKP
jgi:CNT family concentrative nucleoside transporter